jgi:hypothetical protein
VRLSAPAVYAEKEISHRVPPAILGVLL